MKMIWLHDNVKYLPSYVELSCLLEIGGGKRAAVLISFSFFYQKRVMEPIQLVNQKPNSHLIDISCQWKHSASETSGRFSSFETAGTSTQKENAFGRK